MEKSLKTEITGKNSKTKKQQQKPRSQTRMIISESLGLGSKH
jgi:hypothetical protein